MICGIDVSRHQGIFPWDRVAKSIGFAILRSSHGIDTIDEQFERNYAECKRLGIPCGCYHYFYYKDKAKHNLEVANFLRTIKGKRFEFPCFIDYEEYKLANPATLGWLSKSVLTDYAMSDIIAIKQAGFKAGIYANKNWLTNKLDMARIPTDVMVWLAQYATTATYAGRYEMWQYSSSGAIEGYSGRLDVNEFYGLREDASVVKTFSKAKEGELKVSPNFKVKEFACKDGSDTILIDLMLIYYIQKIREHFGKPVTINSAYRTKAYNISVGGANESQHVNGTAADIVISGVTPQAVADYANALGMGGIGVYNTFTHIDTRAIRARWNG